MFSQVFVFPLKIRDNSPTRENHNTNKTINTLLCVCVGGGEQMPAPMNQQEGRHTPNAWTKTNVINAHAYCQTLVDADCIWQNLTVQKLQKVTARSNRFHTSKQIKCFIQLYNKREHR